MNIKEISQLVYLTVTQLGASSSPEQTVATALSLYQSIIELERDCVDKSIPETVFVSVICTLVMDLTNVSNGKPLNKGVFIAIRDNTGKQGNGDSN